jgi:hypothetical protein
MPGLVTIVLLAMSLPQHAPVPAHKGGWPVIQPFSQTFDFPDGRTASVSIAIKDVAGKPVYQLDCHTFLYESDPAFEYSGDFECRLSAIDSPESVSTLLTSDPDQPRDWWSRGRFLAEELQGGCGDAPEYGRSRTFRLRGMELRLVLSDVRIEPAVKEESEPQPRFAAFRFQVTAKPDATALTALAECPKSEPCYKGTPPCFSHQPSDKGD